MTDDLQADSLRDELLVLTSAFRNALIQQENTPDNADARATLREAVRLLNDRILRGRAELLVPYSAGLERMVRCWEAQGGRADGFAVAVGIVEQSLDGLLSGQSAERIHALYEEMRRAFRPEWHVHLDNDGATFDAWLQATTATAASRPSEAPESPEQAFQRELRTAFAEEADEGFAVCEELLVQLEQRPGDRDLLDALFRKFHTLKGAAAAVDLADAAAHLHGGESLLQAVRDATTVVQPAALVDFLLRLIDSVRGLIDRSNGRSESRYAVLTDIPQEIAALSPPTLSATPAGQRRDADPASTGVPPHLSNPAPTRVSPADAAPVAPPGHALTELRDRLGRGERGTDIRQAIDALGRQAQQFWDLATDLKAQVNSLASVPLEGIFRRLQRPVRDAARRAGKVVALEVTGADVRVDRDMAERLYGPLLHLVRNAVSHGIEMPAIREGRGKSGTGSVRVRAELREGDLVLVVDDDGAGLDLAAIGAKARRRGWVDPRTEPTRAELIALIFRPGFSTQDDVTEVAGRGVGMDVVAREIEALDGVIDVESREGQGTRIRLAIPLHRGDAATVRIVPNRGQTASAPLDTQGSRSQ